MYICLLGSGSTGNSLFIKEKKTRILIDAGLSVRQIDKRLNIIGEYLKDIDAIVITHEHIDHTKGIDAISRKYNIPIILNQKTFEKLNITWFICHDILPSNETKFRVGCLEFESFPIPHDAIDPVGYIVSDGQTIIAIATDIGHINQQILNKIRGVHFLIIEANHDPELLWNGPYPQFVKRRISGSLGHLSNEETVEAIKLSYTDNLRGVMLAHLSLANNRTTAVTLIAKMLNKSGIPNLPVFPSYANQPSTFIEVNRNGLRIQYEPPLSKKQTDDIKIKIDNDLESPPVIPAKNKTINIAEQIDKLRNKIAEEDDLYTRESLIKELEELKDLRKSMEGPVCDHVESTPPYGYDRKMIVDGKLWFVREDICEENALKIISSRMRKEKP